MGITDSGIEKALATARLHPIFRGVFAVGHDGIGRDALMFGAVLACGEGTVISHGTAAALLGLEDRGPALIDVTAPGQAGRKLDGIRRHQVPCPRREEISTRRLIPCTSPSRTIVDLAGSRGEWSLRRIVERAAVLAVLDVDAIDACLSNGRRQGSRRARSWATGATPESEARGSHDSEVSWRRGCSR